MLCRLLPSDMKALGRLHPVPSRRLVPFEPTEHDTPVLPPKREMASYVGRRWAAPEPGGALDGAERSSVNR